MGRLLTSLSCQSPESKSGSGQVTCSSGDRQAPTQGLQATASLPGATHPLQTEAVQRLQTLQPRLGAGGAGRGHPSHLASSAAQLPARLFWCYNSSYPLRVMSVDQPIGLLVCPALRLEEQRCAQVPSNHQFILKRAVEPRPKLLFCLPASAPVTQLAPYCACLGREYLTEVREAYMPTRSGG